MTEQRTFTLHTSAVAIAAIARRTTTGLAFLEFDRLNPGFYGLFKQFTFEMIARGRRKHCGVEMVFGRIRWASDFEPSNEGSAKYEGGGEYKVRNAFKPFYARMFMLDHPEHKGFFSTATMRGETHEERLRLYTKTEGED